MNHAGRHIASVHQLRKIKPRTIQTAQADGTGTTKGTAATSSHSTRWIVPKRMNWYLVRPVRSIRIDPNTRNTTATCMDACSRPNDQSSNPIMVARISHPLEEMNAPQKMPTIHPAVTQRKDARSAGPRTLNAGRDL